MKVVTRKRSIDDEFKGVVLLGKYRQYMVLHDNACNKYRFIYLNSSDGIFIESMHFETVGKLIEYVEKTYKDTIISTVPLNDFTLSETGANKL